MRIKALFALSILASLLFIGGCRTGKTVSTVQKVPIAGDQAKGDQANKGDAILKGAKTFGAIASAALTEAIPYEKELADQGLIDKTVEPDLRQWLLDGQKATEDWNIRLKKYDHFDLTSRADIIAFMDEADGFISNLENHGILRIKNARSQAIARGILFGVKAANSYFKLNYGNQLKN